MGGFFDERLKSAFAFKHCANGSDQDFDVVQHAAVLQVKEVIADLLAEAFDIVVVSVDDLSNPGESWFQAQPLDIVWDFR